MHLNIRYLQKNSILCLRSMPFCTPTTKEITHAESFFVRLHAARRKNLSARRRSSGLNAWNAEEKFNIWGLRIENDIAKEN